MKCPYVIENAIVGKITPECAPESQAKALLEKIKTNLPTWKRKAEEYLDFYKKNRGILSCINYVSNNIDSNVPFVPYGLMGRFWKDATLAVVATRNLEDILKKVREPMDIYTYRKLSREVQFINTLLRRLEMKSNRLRSILAKYGNIAQKYSKYCMKTPSGWQPKPSLVSYGQIRRRRWRHGFKHRFKRRFMAEQWQRTGRFHMESMGLLASIANQPKSQAKPVPVVAESKESATAIPSTPTPKVIRAAAPVVPVAKKTTTKASTQTTTQATTQSSLSKYLPLIAGAGIVMVVLANRG